MEGWREERGGDSHAPISTQLQTPSMVAFVVAGCMQLKKERSREANRKRVRERKSKSPWRIGGSVANTVNSRQGSAALLNSLYDCQGGCENSTCW